MKTKHTMFPLVMGILASVCFLAIALWFSSAVQPPFGKILLLLIPALLFFTVAVLAGKGKLSNKATVVVTTIMTVVQLVLSFFYTILLVIETATTETTDVRYYKRAYRQIAKESYVEGVFPASVPEDAQNVSFSYVPQFLQGGEEFKLSYQTTAEKIDEWTERLEQVAKWSGDNDEWRQMHSQTPMEEGIIRYELYWHPYMDDSANHGTQCYVLIDPISCRIEFRHSRW